MQLYLGYSERLRQEEHPFEWRFSQMKSPLLIYEETERPSRKNAA